MEYLFNIITGIELLVCLLFLSHYIYLETGFSTNNGWYLFFCCFLISMVVIQFLKILPEDISLITPFIFFGIYIFLARSSRRIRGLFLVIPVSGLLFSFVSLAMSIPYVFNGRMVPISSGYYYVFDALVWVGFFLFWLKGKAWRLRFKQELAFRKLTRWERRLLNVTGSFLFFLAVLMISVADIIHLDTEIRLLLAVGSIGTVLLQMTLIGMVAQGNRKSYFHNIAIMNEHYLNIELSHFETFRRNQEETRRIRHDMKNHMLCLRELAGKGCYDELNDYLDNLGNRVLQTDDELHCGNEIGDAILNQKNQNARDKGIRIRIQGRMAANTRWNPIDICTIFSNALDNAIEALVRLETFDFEPWIEIQCSDQGSAQLIAFENPTDSQTVIRTVGLTAKDDKDNHGFGLMNIQLAAEKYQGQVTRTVENRDGHFVYRLEVLLFAPS